MGSQLRERVRYPSPYPTPHEWNSRQQPEGVQAWIPLFLFLQHSFPLGGTLRTGAVGSEVGRRGSR